MQWEGFIPQTDINGVVYEPTAVYVEKLDDIVVNLYGTFCANSTWNASRNECKYLTSN